MFSAGPSPWTPEVDELMRVNWTVGISATECSRIIYAKFGVMFTRVAIIGRATRRGYKTTGSNRLGRPRDPNKIYPDSRKKRPRRTIAPRFGAPRAAMERAPPPQPHKPIESRNMTLLELGQHDCRYPTSPDNVTSHLFCGAPQAEGSSYCAHHAALVLRGPPRGAGRLGGNPDFKVGPQGRLRALTNDHHDLEMAAPDLPHGKTRSEHSGSSC